MGFCGAGAGDANSAGVLALREAIVALPCSMCPLMCDERHTTCYGVAFATVSRVTNVTKQS